MRSESITLLPRPSIILGSIFGAILFATYSGIVYYFKLKCNIGIILSIVLLSILTAWTITPKFYLQILPLNNAIVLWHNQEAKLIKTIQYKFLGKLAIYIILCSQSKRYKLILPIDSLGFNQYKQLRLFLLWN